MIYLLKLIKFLKFIWVMSHIKLIYESATDPNMLQLLWSRLGLVSLFLHTSPPPEKTYRLYSFKITSAKPSIKFRKKRKKEEEI